jgi:hypothetical protein
VRHVLKRRVHANDRKSSSNAQPSCARHGGAVCNRRQENGGSCRMEKLRIDGALNYAEGVNCE